MADTVRVGPIVGEVTATATRVVVQPRRASVVTVELTPSGGGAAVSSDATAAKTGDVVVLVFAGLVPDTTYALRVLVDGVAAIGRRGRVVTKALAPTRLRVAAVSCNFTVRQGDARLWERLWQKWVRPGTVNTVLHVGDQIYADTAFEAALVDVRANGQTALVRRRTRRAFEDLYANVWNYPATRKVLAHASNLMIWDDHEIRNSWGGFAEDRDPTSDAFFVGRVARRVFQQFQRALWGDGDLAAPHEAHAHAYGDFGVLFLDQRTGRSFAHTPERPYLGTPQWSWLRQEMRSGALANARALILVTSVPLCYVNGAVASAGGFAISDLRDHWTHPDHRTEQIELLTEIRRWLRAAPDRELLVVGGDVHVGGRTLIEEKVGVAWRPLCRQIITSPITNGTPGALAFFGLRELVLRGVHAAGDTFRFDHEEPEFTNRRNFALITLRARPGEPARIHASLELDADD